MIFIAFLLILLGMYLLFMGSEKYRSPKSRGHFKSIAQKYYRYFKIAAFMLFGLCALILIQHYKFSIGFVSWWIFATPLTFILILLVNPLKSSK
ncbi:DUF1634 domain-containing protein [Acinetobacter oleivorans]|uniref:DUF1634 domain-containing protein n=1 Tax=Acinetobacter oleivorans TaxID=1148157 RepID=UPI000E7ED26E|nr:DUF1634 domain-containing protein [Acinetobacter oleivorans]MBE2171483.1 DUF1634 domain-containing protein [Acinetobacter oleivorans]MDY7371478.1 DUF1634 domain-containing protein [Acinetobacter oleivorans]HBU89079.1 DUF1634 domain-containing protein [Acinetobacter sp.]